MWSPSKALFGNQINKKRKTHLHSSRCSRTWGNQRGAGWRLLPADKGLARTSSSKLSSHGGRVTDGSPSADSSGTPRLHFSLPPTSKWQVLPNLELSEPPPPPQSTDQKHYAYWVTLTSFAKCIPPGLSKPSAGEVRGVHKKLVWGLRGYMYELWVLEPRVATLKLIWTRNLLLSVVPSIYSFRFRK